MRGVTELFDVDAIERVESELDRLVERRAREARDASKVEELWKESVRRDHERRRAENRAAWIAFHRGLARTHAALSESHEERAARLAAVAQPMAQRMEGAA
jgi:hypothetical protein